METTLTTLVDENAFLSCEHQAHLADLHGNDDWNVDFTEGRFWFTSSAGVVTNCAVQFLGSAAPGPASWLWGWENINGYHDDVLVAARTAQASAVPELSTAELPLESMRSPQPSALLQGLPVASPPDHTPVLDDELPYRLVVAAKALSGCYVHYSPVVGGGSQVWLLLDIPGFTVPALDVPGFLRVIGDGLRSVRITDHRRAVLAHAQARRLPVQSTPDEITVSLPDGVVSITLDDLGRISNLTGSAR